MMNRNEPARETLKKPFEYRQRLKSFHYAFQGLALMFRTQHNTWIHATVSLMVIILGFVLKISLTEWAILCFAIGFVFAAEAFNTAIEFLVDLVSPGKLLQAGMIKDLAAAGVLIAAMTAVAAGLFVFIPRLLE